VNQLLTKLKALLEADATLAGYVEVVDARKWRADSLPEFEQVGIVLSPESVREELIAVRAKQTICRVDIVCLVFKFDPVKSLFGTAAGEEGIIKLEADIRAALLGQDLDGYIELSEETCLPAASALNAVPSAERDGFYHEVKIPASFGLMPVEF
jgi:hypothetical protein